MTGKEAGIEGPHPTNLEDAIAKQAVIFKDTFPGMLGVHVLEAGPGRAVATLEVGPSVRHPGGYAHGGALAGFGDTTAAWATFPALGEGEAFTTIEFKANFITGVTSGRLRAEAKAVHQGRRTMVLEVRIATDDEQARPVAMMIVTQAILKVGGSGAGEEQPPDR
jgi:1,4-dihydroxy-2-naphthoyl-CoA hydrolase